MATKTDIKREARRLRDDAVPRGSVRPTPVVQIAQDLGYAVTEFKPTASTKLVSGAVNHEKKSIFVNAEESAARRRFTIAHEIGHIILHGTEENQVDYRRQMDYGEADQPRESEANRFAGELLMPTDVFEAMWQAYGGSIKSVAQHFQVSVSCAEVRASELNLER